VAIVRRFSHGAGGEECRWCWHNAVLIRHFRACGSRHRAGAPRTSATAHVPPSEDIAVTRNSGLRVVAAFEAGKGLVVLFAGFGLLALVHKDLQQLAEELVRHTHLNPASRYPQIFIELAGRAADMRLWVLAAFAFVYAAIRLAEAYGLWHLRRWAEWLAVASGGIYVPAEIYELVRGPSWLKLTTLTINVGIVAYMGWALYMERRERKQPRIV
jgi:uncharacterized membrane protein (DUF2068 family)